jgi:hypothetical protein
MKTRGATNLARLCRHFSSVGDSTEVDLLAQGFLSAAAPRDR